MTAKLDVDVGVSLTGFAGPSGDRVGEVWISVAGPHGRFVVRQHHFGKELARDEVRLKSCEAALEMLHDALKAEAQTSLRKGVAECESSPTHDCDRFHTQVV